MQGIIEKCLRVREIKEKGVSRLPDIWGKKDTPYIIVL
jgi:hypothetical protein